MSYTLLLMLGIIIVYPLIALPLLIYDLIQLKRWERRQQP